jgi:hypothetical protein
MIETGRWVDDAVVVGGADVVVPEDLSAIEIDQQS